MKIIQLITELYPAGAEKVLLNLSRELKKRGHDISVISIQPLPTKQTDIIDDLLESGISVTSLNVTKFMPWKIFKLIKILKSEIKNIQTVNLQLPITNYTGKAVNPHNYQLVIHAHLIHANLISRIISLFLNKRNIRIINTIHIAEKRKSKWWHFFLDKLTFKLCNVQTAVSEAAQQHHAHKIGVTPKQIPVIYNGILLPKQLTKEAIQLLKKEWNFENCDKIIGSVGRLDWQKGYDIFLKIIPELSKKIPLGKVWGIVILGEGNQRNVLEKIISERKCTNIKIILPGYRKDASDCIAAFDLFIMPSRYEGFGLTLIEAMAHGVPCLCSKSDSLPKLINDYQNGKNTDFESNDIIEQIIKYSALKKQKPYFQYSIENMANEYIKFYSK